MTSFIIYLKDAILYFYYMGREREMPRVSQKDALKTRQKIIDGAIELILTLGFSALTFTNIAVIAGVGRSSINGHFRKKEDLIISIRPIIASMIERPLDFTSASAFYDSWVSALENCDEYRHLIKGLEVIISSAEGVAGLKMRLPENDSDVDKYIYMAIGYAVVNLSQDI